MAGWLNSTSPNKVMTPEQFFNIGTGLPAAYALLAIVELSSHLSTVLTTILYAILTLFGTAILAFILYDKYILAFMVQDAIGSESLAETLSSEDPKPTIVQLSGIVLPAFVTVVVAFAQLCRYLSMDFGGFSSQSVNYWDWLRMSASWVLDNGLFNFGQIFHWSISTISPTELWSRILVLLFNIALDVLAFGAVLRYVRAIAGIQVDFRPRVNLHWPRIVPFAIIIFLGTAYWLIPTWAFAFSLVNLSLVSLTSVLTAVREYAPPVFALWMIFWSVWGFKAAATKVDKAVLLIVIAASVAILFLTFATGTFSIP